MKKIFVVAAVLLAAVTMKAEVISRDTIAYDGQFETVATEKVNDFGEVSHTYYVVITNGDKQRKVRVTKADYNTLTSNADLRIALVYNTDANNNRKIAKAVVINNK